MLYYSFVNFLYLCKLASGNNNSVNFFCFLDPWFQIVGAFWYIFAVQRNDSCWKEACSGICQRDFLYCGNQRMDGYDAWSNNSEGVLNASCSAEGDDPPFDYGIFGQALSSGIVSTMNFVSKYCYCLWWGLQNLR